MEKKEIPSPPKNLHHARRAFCRYHPHPRVRPTELCPLFLGRSCVVCLPEFKAVRMLQLHQLLDLKSFPDRSQMDFVFSHPIAEFCCQFCSGGAVKATRDAAGA
jgi:hypothetical protein